MRTIEVEAEVPVDGLLLLVRGGVLPQELDLSASWEVESAYPQGLAATVRVSTGPGVRDFVETRVDLMEGVEMCPAVQQLIDNIAQAFGAQTDECLIELAKQQ